MTLPNPNGDIGSNRQQSARQLADSHVKWYKEFGHPYLFRLAGLTGRTPEEMLPVAQLLATFELKSELMRLAAIQAQTLQLLAHAMRPQLADAEVAHEDP